MVATVSILNTHTGETRIFRDTYVRDGDDIGNWEYGNYSCDCNRGLFSGEEQIECTAGKYKVAIFCEGYFVYDEITRN